MSEVEVLVTLGSDATGGFFLQGESAMERSERELIERAALENFEVKKLYEQHRDFEDRLRTLSRQSYLTPKEEQEERELKHRKLKGVERMLRLAASAQSHEAPQIAA